MRKDHLWCAILSAHIVKAKQFVTWMQVVKPSQSKSISLSGSAVELRSSLSAFSETLELRY